MRVCPSQSCPASVRTDPSRRLRARSQRMAMLADTVELVIGVDTHKDPHTAAVVAAATGAYGAGLTRFLHAHAEQVIELDRPKRAARRHGAKSDPLDAIRAAREALGRDQLAQPRAAGQRAALQVRLTARRSAVQAATDAQRQLHALVVAAPDTLRSRLRGLTTPRLVSTCGRLRLQTPWDTETI